MSETMHPSETQRIGDMAPSSQGGYEICHQKCQRILCIPGSEDTMQSPRSWMIFCRGCAMTRVYGGFGQVRVASIPTTANDSSPSISYPPRPVDPRSISVAT